MSFFSSLGSKAFRTYQLRVAFKLGVSSAIILDDLVDEYEYHLSKKELSSFPDQEGNWFYYTHEKCYDRTALTRKQQDLALDFLLEKQLIQKVIKDCPPKRYFKINIEKINEFFSVEKQKEQKKCPEEEVSANLSLSDKLICPKGTNPYIDNEPPSTNHQPTPTPSAGQPPTDAIKSDMVRLVGGLEKEAKEKLLAPFELKGADLERAMEKPLEKLRLSLEAFEEYRSEKQVEDPTTCLMNFILKEWVPKVKVPEMPDMTEIMLKKTQEQEELITRHRHVAAYVLEKLWPTKAKAFYASAEYAEIDGLKVLYSNKEFVKEMRKMLNSIGLPIDGILKEIGIE